MKFRFRRTPTVRKTISVPHALLREIAPKAREFPSFSAYLQALIRKDSEGGR